MHNYSIDWLLERIAQEEPLKYLFFWGHQLRKDRQISESCFSQWWVDSFVVDEVTYPTAEHYMMAEKARLFGDVDALASILSCRSPAEAKKFGRTVQNFNPTTWDTRCFDIVVAGNYLKFSQHPELYDFLLTTGDRILVEASPVDSIWGIGLAKDHADVANPAKWPGKNLLGFALMTVRDQLRKSN